MKNISKRIKIDLYSPTTYEVVKTQQGDNNSRIIEFEIYDKGEPYIISDTVSFTVEGTRGDGSSFIIDDYVVNDNIVSVVLTYDILRYPGNIVAKLVMYERESILSTTTFKICCEKYVVDKDNVIKENQNLIDYLVNRIKDLQYNLSLHKSDKENPHEVSKEQVGLGNVPNVITNDQTPTYEEAETLENISSGEVLSVAFGKISKAISSLISHIKDTVIHITSTERDNWNFAKEHADSAHAPADAQKNQNAFGTIMSTDGEINLKATSESDTVRLEIDSPITIKQLNSSSGYRLKIMHSQTTGYKHIPSGGADGQILRWSKDGTAVWGSDNNTTYSDFTGCTASAAGTHGLVPAPPENSVERILCANGEWAQLDLQLAKTNGTLILRSYLNGNLTNTINITTASTEYSGVMSASDKIKLDGIETGAQVNQNSFGKLKVVRGSIIETWDAKSSEDTLVVKSGDNMSVSFSEENGLVISGNYGNATQYGNGLMSTTDKIKLDNCLTETQSRALFALKSEITDDTKDSGWQTATLTNAFELYSATANPVQYRKVGKIVYVEGAVKPAGDVSGSGDTYTIFTLPSGYRPANNKYFLCQGSTKNTWLCTVGSNGNVTFSRYGTNTYADPTTSTWLPFNFSFLTD